jgi:hypothetical protein
MPVALDSPQLYDLARFGRPAGIVLADRRRTSAALQYTIPEPFDGRWVKVVVRMRATFPRGRLRGFAHVTAVTDGRVSASIELEGRGRAVRWSAVGLHEGRSGRTASRRLRVSLSNYARVQAGTPGTHALRFRVKTFDGFRLRRVRIEPGSGLLVTRQPPQALKSTAVLEPLRPRAGTSFVVRLAVTNIGVLPARDVHLRVLAQQGLRPAEPLPRLHDIPPGGSVDVTLPVDALAEGDRLLQVLTESDVGQDVLELEVPVDPAASGTAAAEPPDGGLPPWAPLGAAVAATALTATARRRLTRRRV